MRHRGSTDFVIRRVLMDSVEDAERCTLTSSAALSQLRLTGSPTRARLPRLAKPQQGFPIGLLAIKQVSRFYIQDLSVPMLSLCVLGLVDFAQVRWGPEIVYYTFYCGAPPITSSRIEV